MRFSLPSYRIPLALTLLIVSVNSAGGSDRGSISGRVTDAETGRGIPYVQVVVMGTTRGIMTTEDGTFLLYGITPGDYDVKVMMIGYLERARRVTIRPGLETRLDFVMQPTVIDIGLPEVVVTAPAYAEHLNTRAETVHQVRADELTSIAAGEVEEVLALTPGVLARAGQLHVRGARGDALQVRIDGIPVEDPLAGQEFTPAMASLESARIILGGLEAQYGNAKAGVLDYVTKEGQNRFGGEIRYTTDRLLKRNLFDNLDRYFLGLGGPSPVRNLTYYASLEVTTMDDHPAPPERGRSRRLLDFISLPDRKTQAYSVQAKLAYRLHPELKMTLEGIAKRTARDEYHHMWTWDGYVETYFDTTRTGRVVRRHGRTSQFPINSSYEYYNAAEHTPDVVEAFDQLKFILNHIPDEKTRYSLRLSRQRFHFDSRVEDKEPWEYEGASESDFWYNYHDRHLNNYFVIAGDYPLVLNRETTTYTSKFDFSGIFGEHHIQTGMTAFYNEVRLDHVERPYRLSPDGQIGYPSTRYHHYNPEGSIYVQDRWQHEGMVLNAGLRFDANSVGTQIPISEVRQRWKTQLSPRLGVAYPLTERDIFSFHYGRFCQFPKKQYVLDDRRVYTNRPRGDPNLDNETTIGYQAGIQHMFNPVVFAQVSVYRRETFGLVTAEEIPDPGGVENIVVYANKDYASSRGFEVMLARGLRDGFRGEISYTFGVATGVASDPNAAVSRDFIYLPVTEQPLDWDARHQLSAHLYVVNPGVWGVDMIWSYVSGLPYTPVQRYTREIRPQDVNSRRLPATVQLNLNVERYFGLWGQNARLFLMALNVLDTRNVAILFPEDLLTPPAFRGRDYEMYYTETGRAGGAYLGPDVTGDEIQDWVPLHDPLVFGPPRTVRLGMAVEF